MTQKVIRNSKWVLKGSCLYQAKKSRNSFGQWFSTPELARYFEEIWNSTQTSIPHTPEQSGLAERMNKTLVEKTKYRIFYADLKKMFLEEAVATAVVLWCIFRSIKDVNGIWSLKIFNGYIEDSEGSDPKNDKLVKSRDVMVRKFYTGRSLSLFWRNKCRFSSGEQSLIYNNNHEQPLLGHVFATGWQTWVT